VRPGRADAGASRPDRDGSSGAAPQTGGSTRGGQSGRPDAVAPSRPDRGGIGATPQTGGSEAPARPGRADAGASRPDRGGSNGATPQTGGSEAPARPGRADAGASRPDRGGSNGTAPQAGGSEAPARPGRADAGASHPDCGGVGAAPQTGGSTRGGRPALPDQAPQENAPRGGIHRNTYAGRPSDRRTSLPGGRTEFRDKNGRTIRTNSRGEVTRVAANAGRGGRIEVSRGPRGERMVETRRSGTRIVSYGPRSGFVERSVRPGYVSRTYIRGGRSHVYVYRGYRYRGFPYYHYMPAIYYGPRFYQWALTPWAVPAHYVWFGMGAPAPWFRFYAGYFTPYPVYAAADLWLTDYLLAENLRLAYESQQAGGAEQSLSPLSGGTSEPTVSPAVKALIADEVRKQLAAEQSTAAQPPSETPADAGGDQVPPAFRQSFFVVSSNLDVTAAGQACSLTPGDIIQRKGNDVSAGGTVTAEVVASKPGDCAVDSPIDVGVADLQEMQNQFREQIDSGLKLMAENQARGLPPMLVPSPRLRRPRPKEPKPNCPVRRKRPASLRPNCARVATLNTDPGACV